MKRESLYHPRKRPAMIRPLLTCTAIVSAFGIPFSTIGLAYGSTATNTGSTASTSSAAAQATVTRINQYPSDDNFYQVIDGTLYHFIGKVGNPVASFPVGAAPTFAKTNVVYVRDANHKFYERRTDGDFLVGTYIPPYEALDLHIPTPIKATDIDQFIAKNSPNSPLIGFGQAFLDAQAKYGVNALYLASHAILESFYGTSMIAVNKHNLFGYQAYDSDPYSNAAYFNSFTDSINWQAYFIGKQYLSTTGDWYGGSPNLDGMNVHYASDPYWAEKIAGIMNRLHPYNPSEYTNAKPLTSTAAAPQGPISDPISQIIKATTPLSATGVTTDSVNFRSEPSTESVPLDVLQPNTKVKVTGVSGNWYRVTVGNTDGWLWKDYVRLDNQDSRTSDPEQTATPTPVTPAPSPTKGSGSGSGSAGTTTTNTKKPNAVTTDDVNFRSQPSLTSQVYQVLAPGTPITILTVNEDNWYKIQVGDQVGWIYRDYVKINDQGHSNISILINGETQSYDPSPIVVNGRTLVPMRGIFESLGAQVSWDGRTNTVTAKKGTTTIELQIGSNIAKINGTVTHLDSKPILYHNRTLVPIRFVSQALGANVQWDGLTQHVFITHDLV